MANNKIFPWAQTDKANILSDEDYATAIATNGRYEQGVKGGLASSEQANKSWRQATVPASGLAQLMVDQLNVDVTDKDAPSLFADRLKNVIVKLAQISPFNASFANAIGGYRKYAIVSDQKGQFWVSTIDNNVTEPNTDEAKWINLFDNLASQPWADNRFLKLNSQILQTVESDVSFNGDVGVTNHGVVIKTTDGKPNQDGWTLGYSLAYQLDDAGNQQVFTYAQKGPNDEVQHITAVKGQGKTAFYSQDNNGNFVCNTLTTSGEMVNGNIEVGSRDNNDSGTNISHLLRFYARGYTCWVNSEEIVGQGVNLVFATKGAGEAAYMRLTEKGELQLNSVHVNQLVSYPADFPIHLPNQIFTFHNDGNLDANGDFFAKRREVTDEAAARENSDRNLQNNINGVQTNLNNEANMRQNADNAIQTDVNNKYNDLNGRKADRSQLPFPENMKVQLFSVFFARGISIWNNDANDYRLQTVNLPTAFTGGFHNVFCSTIGKTPPTLSVQIINNNQLNVGMHQTNYDYLVNDLTINFMAVGYY